MVLKGARQVGKTWLMREFGQQYYDSYVYFNFDEEDELKSTLIIFDEIQECPDALNTLKYFREKANNYHVIAAGNLLGTLLASYHNYLIIGGMPECVASWVKYKDPAKISQIQRELIEVYENDFSKHNGKVNSGRLLMVFRSIVSQLAKPNEKFMYGVVREGGRARDFEEAIEWLVSAGMLNRVYNVSKMEHPLSAFDKLDQFKLFVFDTGLSFFQTRLSKRRRHHKSAAVPRRENQKPALTTRLLLQLNLDSGYRCCRKRKVCGIDYPALHRKDILMIHGNLGLRIRCDHMHGC